MTWMQRLKRVFAIAIERCQKREAAATINENGNNIWLVGNVNCQTGAGVITIAVQLVTGGEFMGGKTATRLPAGSVQITAPMTRMFANIALNPNFPCQFHGDSKPSARITSGFGATRVSAAGSKVSSVMYSSP